MSLTVEPPFLYGYADQIEHTRNGAWADLSRYCGIHCADTAGLDGALAPARLAVEVMHRPIAELFRTGGNQLLYTALPLREAAERYERSDAKAADSLYKAMGRNWDMPADYREVDVRSGATGFSSGPALSLPPPGDHAGEYQFAESVHGVLGRVNALIRNLTGYDVLEHLMPMMLGDPGALRRLADAHGTLEQGLLAIKVDLETGMNTLSTHWTSDGSGASTAFDFTIRERWIPALDAFAQVNDAAQQLYESFAAQYAYQVGSVLFAVQFTIGKIMRLIAAVRSALSAAELAAGVMKLVRTLKDLITDAYEQIKRLIVMLKEGVEAIVACVVAIMHIFSGDFDTLETS